MENGIKPDTQYPFVEVKIKGTNHVIRFIRQGEEGVYETTLQDLVDFIGSFEEPVPPVSWWKGDPTCGGITENYGLKGDSNE